MVGLPIPNLAVIFIIVLFFVILGMFMDIMGIVYVTVPILAPVVSRMGYDLVWFGVVLLVVAVLGGITPPFGGNLFILKASIKESTLGEIYQGAMPFVWITLAIVIAIVLFPEIIMFLPGLMR
jgi:TRAP-type C4-dicarboxylate transport system permease large subunit